MTGGNGGRTAWPGAARGVEKQKRRTAIALPGCARPRGKQRTGVLGRRSLGRPPVRGLGRPRPSRLAWPPSGGSWREVPAGAGSTTRGKRRSVNHSQRYGARARRACGRAAPAVRRRKLQRQKCGQAQIQGRLRRPCISDVRSFARESCCAVQSLTCVQQLFDIYLNVMCSNKVQY
jgi:hypothetical protein